MSDLHATPTGQRAPREVQILAESLAQAHGCRVIVSMEASGYHIYLPCPDCLHTHGKRELQDPKYAINASKYLGLGDKYSQPKGNTAVEKLLFSNRALGSEDKTDTGTSICMRTRQSREPHRFSVTDLKNMLPISVRHPDIMSRAEIAGKTSGEKEEHWEADPLTGVVGPPLPGELTPVMLLPDGHPCKSYIVERGYDPLSLYRQFGACFCTEEYPEGKNDIFYRRFPAGWKDTSSHRLILFSITDGVRKTWQARIIEKLSDDKLTKLMLHPYRKPFHWSKTAIRSSQNAAWIPLSPFDETDSDGNIKFVPSKYRTAKYSYREIMGWDAAVNRAQEDFKWCVLCEGPLDAARVGPGGIAVLGSSLSPSAAAKIAATFHVVISAFDNDKAGAEATDKIRAQLMSPHNPHPVINLVEPMIIPNGKDIGEMRQEEFNTLLDSTMRRVKRKT